MALEPYDPCPCGNGKKFKFCCQPIIEDLRAVERLIFEQQPKQALVAAEKLEPLHTTNPLVLRYKIMAMFMLGRLDEARELIKACQTANPQDPYGYFFEIRLLLITSDWEHTRPLVERHLTFIAEKQPRLGFEISMEVVEELMDQSCYMAAWRYGFEAMQWARTEEEAKSVMSLLGHLHKSSEIPLPYRTMYSLKPLPENQPNQEEFLEALRFTQTRNWTKAAQLFEALSEKDPHQPVLSFNAALCYAWSGDLAAAAELFGRSADDLPDFEPAVQLETLAQLHEQLLPEEQIPLVAYRYKVKSVSRLLSQLGSQPRLYRQPLPPAEQLERPLAASFMLLDKPRDEADPADVKTFPIGVAAFVIFDEVREPEQPAELFLRSISPEFTDADRDFVLGLCGDQIDLTPDADWELSPPAGGIARDQATLRFGAALPPDLKRSEAIKLQDAHFRYVVYEKWPQSPLSALDGLSPAEAAKDPDLHLPVCAAINVVAAVAEASGFFVEVDQLRQQLGLPAVEPVVFQTVEEVKQSGFPDAFRVSPMDAPVEVVGELFRMLLNVLAMGPLRRVLEALYVRQIPIERLEVAAMCQMASGLAIRVADLENAQLWHDRGVEASQKSGADLMTRLEWDLNQLEIYALSGNEEKMIEVIRKCARDYFMKVPECRQQIEQLVSAEKLDDNAQVRAILSGNDLQAVGAGVGGGLWTPESAGSAPAGKLWLPGQE